jgi:hypothetical protein
MVDQFQHLEHKTSAFITQLHNCAPFLIDLSKAERRTIVKLGDKSRGFVFKMLELINHQSDFLPRSFDVAEMEKDVELLRSLYAISIAVSQLNQLIESTLMEVGSEAYMAALVAYRYAKDAHLEGVDDILDDIARRFDLRSRKTPQDAIPSEAS